MFLLTFDHYFVSIGFAQQLIPPDTPSLWAILGQIAVTGLTW